MSLLIKIIGIALKRSPICPQSWLLCARSTFKKEIIRKKWFDKLEWLKALSYCRMEKKSVSALKIDLTCMPNNASDYVSNSERLESIPENGSHINKSLEISVGNNKKRKIQNTRRTIFCMLLFMYCATTCYIRKSIWSISLFRVPCVVWGKKNIVFHYSTEQHNTAQHSNRAYYSGWTKFCKWNVKWNHYKYKRWKKTSMAHKSAFSLSIDGPQANLLERKFH